MNGSRYAYLERICELVAQGEDLVIVSADYAAPALDSFRIDYPSRFISVGIAEQNLIAVSSGLAMSGKRVIAYGCAPFPLLRAFDQIRNTVSIMQIPVNIVVAGIGFGVPEWGATHYNIDDISFVRSLPNFKIITPSDDLMGKMVADYALTNDTPVYVRFDKYAEGTLYDNSSFNIERGFSVLTKGDDVVIITCGSFTARIMSLVHIWKDRGVNAKVVDLFSYPFDEDAFCMTIGESPIITIEEHILSGGIGSIVLEMLSERDLRNRIKRLGVAFNGKYPQTSGSREYYLGKYGLSNAQITATLLAFLDKVNV